MFGPSSCPPKLEHLQTVHSTRTRGERIHLQAKALEHRHVQLRKGVIVLLIERQVLAMIESAAG